jgi:hypothetical protein
MGASFSTCPTREASGRPVNQRFLEDWRVTGASHLQPDDFGCVGAPARNN